MNKEDMEKDMKDFSMEFMEEEQKIIGSCSKPILEI